MTDRDEVRLSLSFSRESWMTWYFDAKDNYFCENFSAMVIQLRYFSIIIIFIFVIHYFVGCATDTLMTIIKEL